MAVATGSNSHRYNHHHKLQPQSPDPPTNSKSKNLNKKKKNSKSSTKPQPNRSINDQTQPTIDGEIGGESCGGRWTKIDDYPWASRASDWRAELQIGELCFKSESPSSWQEKKERKIVTGKKREREREAEMERWRDKKKWKWERNREQRKNGD